MDLLNATLDKDQEKIIKSLEKFDINSLIDGYTALWCSICGTKSKLKNPNCLSNFEITKLLLEKGADPNKKCIFHSALFMATYQGNLDIISILLWYGAEPNMHVVIKFQTLNSKHIAFCKLPLIQAIDDGNYFIVKTLLKFGAIFNKETINYTSDEKEKVKNNIKKSINNYHEKLDNLIKIKKFLLKKYTQKLEDETKQLILMNMTTGNFKNNFIGFEVSIN